MNQPQDPTLNDLFALLKRGFWLALLVGAVLAAAAYFASLRLPLVYQTQTTLLANQEVQNVGGLSTSSVTAPLLDAAAYKAAAASLPVQREAAVFLGDKTTMNQIDLSLQGDLTQSSLLYVSARGPDPERAAQAADATAQALVQWDERRAEHIIDQTATRLEAQLKSMREQISALSLAEDASRQAQRNELLATYTQVASDLNLTRSLRDSGTSSLEVLEPAPVPVAPIEPNPLRNAVVAFVLGVFLSYGIFFLRNALRRQPTGFEGATGFGVQQPARVGQSPEGDSR